MNRSIPKEILNWINNEPCPAESGEWFEKYKPAAGKLLCRVARSGAPDVKRAFVEGTREIWMVNTIV